MWHFSKNGTVRGSVGVVQRLWQEMAGLAGSERRRRGPGTACGLGPAVGRRPSAARAATTSRRARPSAVSGRRVVLEKHDSPRASGLSLTGPGGVGGTAWSARTLHGTASQFVAMFLAEMLCQRLPPLFYNLYRERKAMLTARRRRRALTSSVSSRGSRPGRGPAAARCPGRPLENSPSLWFAGGSKLFSGRI